MSVINLSGWLGASLLYVGFASALGLLLRRARQGSGRVLEWGLFWIHGLLLVLPTTILILTSPQWPLWSQLPLLALSLALVWAYADRPNWAPPALWQPRFRLHYLSAAMVTIAFWGLLQGSLERDPIPLFTACAAAFAAVAVLRHTRARAERSPHFEVQ